jgi:hypothetical protein
MITIFVAKSPTRPKAHVLFQNSDTAKFPKDFLATPSTPVALKVEMALGTSVER